MKKTVKPVRNTGKVPCLPGTVHFDASGPIGPLLVGARYGFSLIGRNIRRVKERQTARIVTVKSQSRITAQVLREFPLLQLVVTRTAGTDHIDMEACARAGVAVRNIPDYSPSGVAEHAFALMLSLARNIVPAALSTKSGAFKYEPFLGLGLKGKTLGVIGTGRIGIEALKIGKGFGMELLAYDVYRKDTESESIGFAYVPLGELLKQSDFVSVHVPLLPETRHLLGRRELSSMKKGSVLVNTARGGVIDTEALVSHVSRFRGVALDVLEDEAGFNARHPLLSCPNVLITPHIGFYTDTALKRIAGETAQIIAEFENSGKVK